MSTLKEKQISTEKDIADLKTKLKDLKDLIGEIPEEE